MHAPIQMYMQTHTKALAIIFSHSLVFTVITSSAKIHNKCRAKEKPNKDCNRVAISAMQEKQIFLARPRIAI